MATWLRRSALRRNAWPLEQHPVPEVAYLLGVIGDLTAHIGDFDTAREMRRDLGTAEWREAESRNHSSLLAAASRAEAARRSIAVPAVPAS
ncbi:hypothetical protein ACFC1R_30440 [Kitasatospora sp. NPDC056138]|uniref:hypothetical protein n=1 Tax=Kitasatospora sp. NPDC056138 TaxID=3345724 RepID=UPI0035E23B5B